MNEEEKATEIYLKSLGVGRVVFEPDGNTPPDFSVADEIAIEVRRLNQLFIDGGKIEGLEQITFPLYDALQEALDSFNLAYKGVSYWVAISYSRPFYKSIHKLKSDMKIGLESFLNRKPKLPHKIYINENINLTLYESAPITGRVFTLAGGMDHDSGGWVLSIYVDSIRQCVIEKSTKINSHLSRYKKWHLILVDRMGWGLDKNEVKKLASQINDLGNFEEVQVISGDGATLLARITTEDTF